jgi:hypothetical protein
MKKKILIKTGFSLALATVPFSAGATTGQAALEACAERIVSDLADTRGVELSYETDPEVKGMDRRMRGAEVIHLDILDSTGEEVVARADCYVSDSAKVRRIKPLPLEADDAALRAVKAY